MLLTDRVAQSSSTDRVQLDLWDTALVGFGLRISRTGVRTWQYRYTAPGGGKRRRLLLGRWPRVRAAEARQAAREAADQVARGEDPQASSVPEPQLTFRELASQYLEKHSKPKKRSWRVDVRWFERDLLPAWGDRTAAEITRTDVVAELDRLGRRGPLVANRWLALVKHLFNWAVDRELVPANPAGRVKRPFRETRRSRVLSSREIAEFWGAAMADGSPATVVYLLMLLTAQRAGEVKGMRWADLDLEAGWWMLPGESRKSGQPSRVPLSVPAVALIRSQRGTPTHVFRGRGGSSTPHLATPDKGFLRARGAADYRGHDLRRTAATLLGRARVDEPVIRLILGHSDHSVTAIYQRYGYELELREAAAALAAQIEEAVGRPLLERRDGAVLPGRFR